MSLSIAKTIVKAKAKLGKPAGVLLAMALAFPPASTAAAWAMAAVPAVQAEAHSSAAPGGPEKQHGGPKSAESPAVQAIGRSIGLDPEKVRWLSTVLNFLIVAVVGWVLLRKKLPPAFRSRTESIQKKIEDARRASDEARQRLAGVEERLARLDAEIAQMRSEAEAAGKADEERVMKAADGERRRIVQAAQQEISTAANVARRELRAFAADLAVGLAEKKISVSRTADQSLVREFTARLGKEQ